MNEWYVITNLTKDMFVGENENGGAKITTFLPQALIGPYNMFNMFMNLHMDKESRKMFTIKKISFK